MIKVVIGRIRTRAKQSGALWEQDGDTILAEGLDELKTLRERLEVDDALCAPLKK
jgi:cellulase/cellobiase CelA1